MTDFESLERLVAVQKQLIRVAKERLAELQMEITGCTRLSEREQAKIETLTGSPLLNTAASSRRLRDLSDQRARLRNAEAAAQVELDRLEKILERLGERREELNMARAEENLEELLDDWAGRTLAS